MNTALGQKLSPIQKQFWLQHQLNPRGSAYNMASLFEISGFFNIEKANNVLRVMIQKHKILRSVFRNTPKGVDLVILEECLVTIKEKNDSANMVINDIIEPFNLENGPLFRAVLYKEKKDRCFLLLVFHHIVIDLRSKDLFSLEFCLLYNKGAYYLNQSPISHEYQDYTEWIENVKRSKKWEIMRDFWKNEVDGSKPLNLTYDRERFSSTTTEGTRYAGVLSTQIYSELHRYCKKNHSDPLLVLLAVYYILLHKFSGQNRIAVGVPRSNRDGELFSDTLGCFVNILPMIIDFQMEMKFSDVLSAVRKKMLLIHRNQYMPYIDVIPLSSGDSDRKYNPLFQVGFTNEYPMELSLDDLTVEPLPIPGHGSQLDLFLYFWDRNGVYHWELEYNSHLFSQERVKVLMDSYHTILKSVLSGHDLSLNKLSPLSERMENRIICDWNKTDFPNGNKGCVHHYFEEQAKINSERIALIFKRDTLTYGELNLRANNLAEKILSVTTKKNPIIGLTVERSFEMVIGLLGILKAGGAYLPLEPSHPKEYKRFVLEDSQIEVMVTRSAYRDEFFSLDNSLIIIDLDNQDRKEISDPKIETNHNDMAYLFYTSGSTGKPKGVEIAHEGLIDRILWMDRTFNFGKERKTLLKTPYNFDVSGMEFWLPLISGAPLVISEPEGHLDNHYLADVIQQEEISIVHFVPSLLKTFLNSQAAKQCITLKDVICCGEALPPDVVNDFYNIFPHCGLHNLYGPTEATIFITYWNCKKGISFVPIGKPVSNTRVFILDDQLNLLPPGITGEIYLAGIGLANGYRNREELREKFFIPQPWKPSEIMYKSGDLGQWTPEGDILYFGRNDNQIQLHGQRIELGEIENTLNKHPAVDGSALQVTQDFGAEQRLVAYIVKKNQVTPQELEVHISRTLPKYMIPSFFFFIDKFELNSNGKLDRKKLPDPNTLIGNIECKIEEPITKMETGVALIWKKILGRPAGRRDSFFELGGSSLQLMEMQQELTAMAGRSVPVTALFEHITLIDLAEYLEGSDNKKGISQAITSRVEKQKEMEKRKRRP